MGTAIKDNIILTGSSATLALHIWSLMGQENPNIPAAAGVAFIIIIVDFTLSLTVKIVGTQFAKRFKGGK
jgi:phosphate transport system permease protein